MQIFLPFPDIKKSLKCLDKRRLGKQRVEARQILTILKGETDKKGWQNHPAVLMCGPHIDFLSLYYNESLREFEERGGRNNLCQPIELHINIDEIKPPSWFGNSNFHLSHQSNLLRKAISDSEGKNRLGLPMKKSSELLDRLKMYGITVETTPSNLEYIWPVLRTE